MSQGRALRNDERDKIKKLINEGLSNVAVRERTGFGASSISLIKAEMRGHCICSRTRQKWVKCPVHGDRK